MKRLVVQVCLWSKKLPYPELLETAKRYLGLFVLSSLRAASLLPFEMKIVSFFFSPLCACWIEEQIGCERLGHLLEATAWPQSPSP